MSSHRQYFDETLDTSGQLCPYPLLQAKKVLTNFPKGRILRIISTDPSSIIDFKVYATVSDHRLLATYEEQGKYYFYLQKGD